jgi:hypothetical protein
MDVFLGKEQGKQKIFIYENDKANEVASSFGEINSI